MAGRIQRLNQLFFLQTLLEAAMSNHDLQYLNNEYIHNLGSCVPRVVKDADVVLLFSGSVGDGCLRHFY